MRKSKNLYLSAFCICCGLVMLFCLGYTNSFGQGYLVEDSHSYLNLLHSFIPDPFRTMGYPLFLTFIKSINFTIDFMKMAFILQWIFWIGSVWISGRILLQWVQWPYVWVLCGLLLLNPSYSVYSHLILTEIPFIFLIVLSVYGLFRFQATKNNFYLVFAFGLVCIATLFRPGLFYFEILISLALLFFLIHKRDWKSFVMFTAIFSMFIIFPIRQFHQQYQIHKLSIIDDLTIYRYLNARALSLTDNCDLQTAMNKLDQASNGLAEASMATRSAFYRKAFNGTVSEHPYEVIKAFGMNLISNIHTGNTYYNQTHSGSNRHWVFNISRIFNMIYSILLLLSFVLLPILLMKPKFRMTFWQNTPGMIIMLYCLYQFFSSGVSFWQGDRFNIVWMPLLSIGLISWLPYIRMKKRIEK